MIWYDMVIFQNRWQMLDDVMPRMLAGILKSVDIWIAWSMIEKVGFTSLYGNFPVANSTISPFANSLLAVWNSSSKHKI